MVADNEKDQLNSLNYLYKILVLQPFILKLNIFQNQRWFLETPKMYRTGNY